MRACVFLYCILEGRTSALPSTFALPHSVTVAEDRGIVCVADRENGRVQCFDFDGNVQQVVESLQLRPTLYAVTYDKCSGKPSEIRPYSTHKYDTKSHCMDCISVAWWRSG